MREGQPEGRTKRQFADHRHMQLEFLYFELVVGASIEVVVRRHHTSAPTRCAYPQVDSCIHSRAQLDRPHAVYRRLELWNNGSFQVCFTSICEARATVREAWPIHFVDATKLAVAPIVRNAHSDVPPVAC